MEVELVGGPFDGETRAIILPCTRIVIHDKLEGSVHRIVYQRVEGTSDEFEFVEAKEGSPYN